MLYRSLLSVRFCSGLKMADVLGQLMEAVNFAAIKHKDQRRKDPGKTPYINHPIGVAYILWKEGEVSDIAALQVCMHVEIPL